MYHKIHLEMFLGSSYENILATAAMVFSVEFNNKDSILVSERSPDCFEEL